MKNVVRSINTMNTKNTRNSLRRAAALALALVILVLAVPTAMADASAFAGTRWYASGINFEILREVDKDLYTQLKAVSSLISFVPDQAWLDTPSFMAVCCTIEFRRDNTFTISLLASQMGEVDWDTYNTATGTWSSCGDMIRMTVDGTPVTAACSGGTFSLAAFGFGLDFKKV